jgi:asparagine synthase (glutamine-hydrolysing)
MCGIVGIIGPRSKEKREIVVQEMNKAIYHRGPDEAGFFSDNYCTLAMRRLSIIDLKTGNQPLYSDCGKFLIFFNGEIYNFLELRDLLIKKGCVFKSNSDTEVVVNFYKYLGKEMLSQLHGMFAFCIYNFENKSFFFARDRFGEKPFYYFSYDKEFVFSSEVKSLLGSKVFTPKLNKSKLGSYIRLSYVDEPYTLIENVFTLPPGNYLELSSNNKIVTGSYVSHDPAPDNSIKSLEEAAEYIKPFFQSSVQKQMISSDVPIGAFLSGGIDSSSVVATMAKLSPTPIKTFTVKFQTKGYDESSIARKVATKFNTQHHQITVENSQFREEQFWRILDHVGLPFPDSSAIPTDIVTSEIAKHVKVALSGDGGDELFGGYTVFDWISKVHNLSHIPKPFTSFSKWGISHLNQYLNNNKLRQLIKGLKLSNYDIPLLIQETHALFDIEEINELFDGDLDYPIFKAYDPQKSLLRNTMVYRSIYDLPLDMLIKVDRMSMANSLEVRSPFLDPILYQASCNIPDKFLRNNGLGKLVIRKMMEKELPSEVFNHPKSGFSIPLHDFRNDSFKKLAYELLLSPHMKEMFNIDTLNNILNRGLHQSIDDGGGSIYRKTHQLWSLMMLSGWIKKYNISI